MPASDEEEDEEDSEDEDELALYQDWEEMREELASRGYNTSTMQSGLAMFRPNAHAGAGRGAPMQPRDKGAQRLDARFHGGAMGGGGGAARGGVYHDPLDALGGHAGRVSSAVANEVRAHESREAAARAKVGVDKADRATVEQAIDPRTRMVLFKMLNRGLFSEINGCVSTGKEANVYHASTPGGADLAIKVYKTSILVFKDRDRYVSGDFRFRNGYCKSNPRKMVKVWAEKEMRNLARLRAAGINAPAPVQLRLHVLVMDFIGEDGVAAPRLRDADLPLPRLRAAYTEMVVIVRTLYQKCRLVHADLSEYNILYHKGELYIIDVSQAVDLDHPKALDFLREDCAHVNDYFRRQGVATLTTRELFDFAVDPHLREDGIDGALDALMEVAVSRPAGGAERDAAAVEDAVFRQAYLPKRMDEVVHYERDQHKLQAVAQGAQVEGLYYGAVVGLTPAVAPAGAASARSQPASAAPKSASSQPRASSSAQAPLPAAATESAQQAVGPSQQSESEPVASSSQEGSREGQAQSSKAGAQGSGGPDGSGGSEDGEESGSEGSSSSEGSDDEDGSGSGSGEEDEEGRRRPRVDKDAVRAARKANKAAVKEANREKRKVKTPKHVKKSHKSKGKKK